VPGPTPPVPIVAVATVLTVAVPTIMIPLGLDFVLAIAGAITFGIVILILGRWGTLPGQNLRLEDTVQASAPARS
jgi:hypothetical protein